jgi:hypothetical protein
LNHFGARFDEKKFRFWGGLEWYEGDEKIVCRGSRFPVSSEET